MVDTAGNSADSGGVTELGKLIEAASRANKGRSVREAARVATKLGAPISASHISKNARNIESVTPQIVRGIAAGYGIPEEDVARAALADLGFTLTDYTVAPESAIRRDPDLSIEAKAILLAALDASRISAERDIAVVDRRLVADEPQRTSLAGNRRWDPALTEEPPGVGGDERRADHN